MSIRIVGEVMTDEVVRACPDTSFKELARLLTAHRISGLPVVDDDDKVVGVLSQTDLVRRQAGRRRRPSAVAGVQGPWSRPPRRHPRLPHAPTAGALMSSPAVTVHPEQRVVDAARIMERRRVDRLPVVDAEDRLIGIVTRRDLLRVFLRTDETLRAEVMDMVRARVPEPVRDEVRVQVRDGVVRLECPAREDVDTTALLRAAWRVDGVVGVTCGPAVTPPDRR
ncbi:CBS domain-containing protein [Streptomyces sp. MUM 203J]|uniref:CBS domain-containing protein n=1 Tax=Streptomyces sp. MUM 203J TaxID=2791990 RepID=UPI001F0451F3|nr:CBS domain-containing protein [Streptomyces sp. MUM 203J]MCH0541614.1 CBS domain-containing protein [Streptomyces sp. MUM 203J]